MAKRSFRVQWAEAAVRDLEELMGYIAADSPVNADRILEKLERRARTLESTPTRGRVVPELAHFGIRSWRELIVKPHRIIYRVDAGTVHVLAVLDGRRELQDLLLERLIR
jgi:plasmid stabilization system protein ParE